MTDWCSGELEEAVLKALRVLDYLRLTIMSPQTTEQTIEDMLDAIERIVAG